MILVSGPIYMVDYGNLIVVSFLCTSRKLCPKKSQPKSTAVFLTSLIYNHKMATIFSHFATATLNNLGPMIFLERYFQDLSKGILHAPKFLKF